MGLRCFNRCCLAPGPALAGLPTLFAAPPKLGCHLASSLPGQRLAHDGPPYLVGTARTSCWRWWCGTASARHLPRCCRWRPCWLATCKRCAGAGGTRCTGLLESPGHAGMLFARARAGLCTCGLKPPPPSCAAAAGGAGPGRSGSGAAALHGGRVAVGGAAALEGRPAGCAVGGGRQAGAGGGCQQSCCSTRKPPQRRSVCPCIPSCAAG